MSKSVYISAPVSLDRGTVVKYYDQLSELFRVNIWKKGTTYDYNMVHKSDIFVLLTTSNSLAMDMRYLPSGCARELKEAIALGKPIYLGYQTKAGDIYIYEAYIYGNTLSGITGTGGSIFRTHAPTKESESEDVVSDVLYEEVPTVHWKSFLAYDRRILLLL